MKKSFIVLTIFISLLFAQSALANGDDASEHDEDVLEIITTTDLGVEDPGVLPTSPFYFFKEVGRTFQRAFTFDRTAKAELELRITNEKAAEVKKVEEEHPNDENALKGALENYQRAQERLKLRIENLGENSDNPNVDRLLEKLTDRVVLHEKLFEELTERHEAQKGVIESIRLRIEEIAGKAAERDTPEKFKERLRLRLEEGKGSDLKHFRSIDFLERIEKHTSEETRLRLEGLREDFGDKIKERLERVEDEGEEQEDRVRELLHKIPGDALERTKILEDIRLRSSGEGSGIIERFRKSVEQRVEDKDALKRELNTVREKIREQTPVLCTQEYAPVCGNDGKTYSNRCVAEKQKNVDVAYQGECSEESRGVLNCLVADPVCGEDGRTYVCGVAGAEFAGVKVAHKGKCQGTLLESPEGKKVDVRNLPDSESDSDRLTPPNISPPTFYEVDASKIPQGIHEVPLPQELRE